MQQAMMMILPKIATTPPADTPFFFAVPLLGSVDASPPGRVVVLPITLAGTVTPLAAVTTRTNSVVVVVAVFGVLASVIVDVASGSVVFDVADVVDFVTVVSVTVELELVVVVGFAVVVISLVVVVTGGSVKPSQGTNPSLHVPVASSANTSHTRRPPVT